eukprot:4778723-Karenia_brevis.AAC.1
MAAIVWLTIIIVDKAVVVIIILERGPLHLMHERLQGQLFVLMHSHSAGGNFPSLTLADRKLITCRTTIKRGRGSLSLCSGNLVSKL